MKEIIELLPMYLREYGIGVFQRYRVEELRLRIGQPLSYVLQNKDYFMQTPPITRDDLHIVLSQACQYSVHAVEGQVARGFVTVQGGHRVGLCGTMVVDRGKIQGVATLQSVVIRVAREVIGVSSELLPYIYPKSGLENTLILSPPSFGKTTLLRDLIRIISDGVGVVPLRVGVVDERGELCGLHHGVPQFEIGKRTDVMDSAPKSQGLMVLLRCMNPQVLAMDEITENQDIDAIEQGIGCGVKLLATAHGARLCDLSSRPVYRRLLKRGIFGKLVTIEQTASGRKLTVEGI